jgi:hypothetical protein
VDLVDDDGGLAPLLQFVKFVLRPLDVIVILAIALGEPDFVLAGKFTLLEPADQLLVLLIEVARIGFVVSATGAADGVRFVVWIDGAVCCVAQRTYSVACCSWSARA